MEINVITYAAHLVSQLTKKIQEQHQKSIDDFFTRMSDVHKTTITLLKFNGKELRSSNVERYTDGSIRVSNNLWDVLSESEKEEAINLLEMEITNKDNARKLRNYLFSVAQKTIEVNDKHEIVSNNLTSYVKFFNCLPDFITQDRELLLRPHSNFDTLNDNDLEAIKLHSLSLNQDEIKQFVDENRNEEIEGILATVYSLEFLVDYDF